MRSVRLVSRLLALVLFLLVGMALAGCGDNPAPATPIEPMAIQPPPPTDTPIVQPTDTTLPANPTPEVAATPPFLPIPESMRGYVPVLCYHHIRAWLPSDTEDDRAYIVPPDKLD